MQTTLSNHRRPAAASTCGQVAQDPMLEQNKNLVERCSIIVYSAPPSVAGVHARRFRRRLSRRQWRGCRPPSALCGAAAALAAHLQRLSLCRRIGLGLRFRFGLFRGQARIHFRGFGRDESGGNTRSTSPVPVRSSSRPPNRSSVDNSNSLSILMASNGQTSTQIWQLMQTEISMSNFAG